jgi:hypothetical protein
MSNVRSSITSGVLASFWSAVALTQAPPSEPLILEGKIDQLAVELNRQQLSVAPCASPTWPAPSALGSPPSVATWHSQQFPRDWQFPRCTGWDAGRFESFAAVSGTFNDPDVDAIAGRIGAISSYRGMRYWSVTDRRFEVLITDAFAVDGPNPGARRADFTPAEMRAGRELFFVEQDNRSSSPILYRMKIVAHDAGRLIIDFVNVSRVSKLFLTIFDPGDLRTALFVSARGGDTWQCYALSASNPRAFSGLLANDKSLTNRLLAFYAHSARVEDADLPWQQ